MEFLYLFFILTIMPYIHIAHWTRWPMVSVASAVFVGVSVWGGVGRVDGLVLACGMVLGWMVVCNLRSTNWQSSEEVCYWGVGMLVMLVCRGVDPFITCVLIVIPAAVMAPLQVKRAWEGAGGDWQSSLFLFGNSNHNGAYMLSATCAGLWLMLNVTPWFGVVAGLTLGAAIHTGCRAVMVAMLAGVAVWCWRVGCWEGVGVVGIVCVAGVAGYAYRKRHTAVITATNILGRLALSWAAVRMVKRSPVFGWGMNMFKVLFPEDRLVIMQHPMVRSMMGKVEDAAFRFRTHRVHNDHLELMVETGLVGYGLMVWVFVQLPYSSPLMCVTVAMMAVNALFFFVMREEHTSLPYWAVIGAMAGSAGGVVGMPVAAKIAVTAAALLIGVKEWRRLMGALAYDKVKLSIPDEMKRRYAESAVHWTPYSNLYLSDLGVRVAPVNPLKSFDYHQRMMQHIDGDLVQHYLWVNWGKAVVNAGALRIAQRAIDESVRLEPGNTMAARFREVLQSIDGQFTADTAKFDLGGE